MNDDLMARHKRTLNSLKHALRATKWALRDAEKVVTRSDFPKEVYVELVDLIWESLMETNLIINALNNLEDKADDISICRAGFSGTMDY